MSDDKSQRFWKEQDTAFLTSLYVGKKILLDISVNDFKKTNFKTGLSNPDFSESTIKRHMKLISDKLKATLGDKGKSMIHELKITSSYYDYLVIYNSDTYSDLEDYIDKSDEDDPYSKHSKVTVKTEEKATPDQKKCLLF